MTVALSNKQLEVVLRSSEQVNGWYRQRYLNSVLDQLLGLPEFSDCDVARIARRTASAMASNVVGGMCEKAK